MIAFGVAVLPSQVSPHPRFPPRLEVFSPRSCWLFPSAWLIGAVAGCWCAPVPKTEPVEADVPPKRLGNVLNVPNIRLRPARPGVSV